MNESIPKRGRPRSEASKAAILQSAFELLQERGYAALSIEGIAARAKVGKTTLYRWWPDLAALAIESFFEYTKAELVFPQTGSARSDLAGQIHQLAKLLRSPTGKAFAAIVEAGRSDPQIQKALFEGWVLPRKKWGVARLRQAQADGECPPDLNIDAALQVLYGHVYSGLLFGQGIPQEAQLNAGLEIILDGIFRVE